MLFSSLEFLCFFFPVFFLVYFLVSRLCKKAVWPRNAVLLVFSLVFYAWGELSYFWLLMLSIGINYVFALLIGRCKPGPNTKGSRAGAKALLAGDVAVNLALLGVFKYAGLAVTTLNTICGTAFTVPEIALPIGISFFTFQIMSYVIDVYRDKVAPQKNIFIVAVYLCAFPQLIAGPIVRYSDIEEQLANRMETTDGVYRGLNRFIVGLSKKVIIANTCAALCDSLFATEISMFGAAGAWIGMLAYTLQIYFDFSGYSDMAIGMGRMFGFQFPENFRYPYVSRSVSDFWRRWHITLSTWFREYLYIPLGGNRVRVPRNIFNLAVVWMATGLWHGASWNFLLWGAYFGAVLIAEKFLYGKALSRAPGFVGWAYTALVVLVGWVFFALDDLGRGAAYLGAMFGGGAGAVDAYALRALLNYGAVLLLCAAASTPLASGALERLRARRPRAHSALTYALVIAGFALCLIYVVDAGYNPFLYFRF